MDITLKFRDDGKPQFRDERDLSLSPDENMYLLYFTRQLGEYRTRQYEITMVDDTKPFSLIDMWEEIIPRTR